MSEREKREHVRRKARREDREDNRAGAQYESDGNPAGSDGGKAESRQRAHGKSMRRMANLSLLLLALLFAGSAILLQLYPGRWWAQLLLYTAEAGLVGALADLFAVTVLFRSPLGMRWIPHTGILPRNRDKLVDGIVRMVEEQLLAKDFLRERLGRLSLVRQAIDWADSRQGLDALASQGWRVAMDLLRRADLGQLAEQLDGHAREALRRADLTRYSGIALSWLLRHNDVQKWIGQLIGYAAERMAQEEMRRAIADMLEQEAQKQLAYDGSLGSWFKGALFGLAETLDAVNLEEAADTLHRDLQRFMAELQEPSHPLRVQLEQSLHDLAGHLRTSADAAAAIERWKQELAEQLSLQPAILSLLQSMAGMLTSPEGIRYIADGDRALQPEAIRSWMDRLLLANWAAFKADERAQRNVESFLQQLLARMLESGHAAIGRVVRGALDGFTEARLVDLIERRVDPDLQRIRLNGALLGASAGALIYLLLHGVYDPLLRALGA
ncbi:DUF445 domain-containing protein [Paenibacillus sp. IB182496]|uniref:DUF445 domain-containing protein n=1 Tax=Paenibacillus sabuli TaxID=2772509 RepID=A0A927BTU6_9BACL|nr:DUF445 domain-containing protein [Paenibacillus sabuli]MBD2846686.1 DUF445 domain-containing protein [Paenibacillus sabuli]